MPISTEILIAVNIRTRLPVGRAAGEHGSITLSIAREFRIETRTHRRNMDNQDLALRIEKISVDELLIQENDQVPTGKTWPAGILLVASDPQRLTEEGETCPAEAPGGAEVRQCSNPVDRMPLRGWIEVEETPE